MTRDCRRSREGNTGAGADGFSPGSQKSERFQCDEIFRQPAQEQLCRTLRWSDIGVTNDDAMEGYLRNLAARLLRISHASLDIGTARKLRELSREIGDKADAYDRGDDRDGDGDDQRR